MTASQDDDIRHQLELETGQIDGSWRPRLGSVLLSVATVLFFFSAIAGPAPLDIPHAGEARELGWRAQIPGLRFDSVVLYTRSSCHLCHQARETLLMHVEYLSEISEVDIDGDSELVQRYGESVPVVVIDGRERFRGQVDVLLLRRLIDATSPRGGTA